MDEERAEVAIRAFRDAEVAVNELISNADELVASAASLRDADHSVKSLAEAVGIASKLWIEIASELKGVTAEVQAAAKLFQRAEPDELRKAVADATSSVNQLHNQTAHIAKTVQDLGERTGQLTSRIDSVAENTTSLREALMAKMDLHQASVAQVQADLSRLEGRTLDTGEQILAATKRNQYATLLTALIALVAVVILLVS